MTAYAKPLPQTTPLSAPFWEALKARRILVQQCRACASVQHPPLPNCMQGVHLPRQLHGPCARVD